MKNFILFLSVIFVSCSIKTKTDATNDKYDTDHKYTQLYQNEYNERGKLIKVQLRFVSENSHGSVMDYSEKEYFYDGKDRISKIVEYRIYPSENTREISSIKYFTDFTQETINYRVYPNDTALYIFSKYNNAGNEVEIYIKDKLMNIDNDDFEISEKKEVFNYNKDNELMSVKHIDMINKTENIQLFEYLSLQDTVFTKSSIGDALQFKSKNFLSNGYKVEVIEYFSPHSIDSIYSLNNKTIRSVNYDDDHKRIYEVEYDKYENEMKSTEIVFNVNQ